MVVDAKLSTALRKRVDERADEFLQWMVELVSIPSVSASGEGMRECAVALRRRMDSLGIRTELLETGGEPMLWGEIGSGNGPRPIIYGHYDVQPALESEGWSHPPFSPQVRDGAIWGRGVGDNKGQLLTHLCALAAWQDVVGSPPPFTIKFVFDGEEEIGSPKTIPFIRDNPQWFAGDFVYCADGSTIGVWHPAMFLELHGLLYLELRATGAEAEWHSGSYGSVLPNPIHHMAGALRSLVDETGHVLVPGFYDDVVPPTEVKRRLLDLLPPDFLTEPARYGAKRFATANPREAMFLQPKMCVCGLIGGYTGEGVKTAVPTGASAKLDITLTPSQTPEGITALIRQHLDANGFDDVSITPLSVCPPVATRYDSLHFRLAESAMRNVWGKQPVIFASIGGGGPMAAFAALGLECICVPYAQADLHEHSTEEHFSLEWFNNGIKISAEMFRLMAAA